jgi:hypothetical protein
MCVDGQRKLNNYSRRSRNWKKSTEEREKVAKKIKATSHAQMSRDKRLRAMWIEKFNGHWVER